MKKLFIICIVSLLTLNIANSQVVEKITWSEQDGWEVGATNITPISVVNKGGKSMNYYLVIAYSEEGLLKIFSITKDGSVLKKISEKKDLKKGNWAICGYDEKQSDETTTHLFISYYDTGEAESYPFRKGKLGEKTWSTNSFKKGFYRVVPLGYRLFLGNNVTDSSYVFNIKSGDLSLLEKEGIPHNNFTTVRDSMFFYTSYDKEKEITNAVLYQVEGGDMRFNEGRYWWDYLGHNWNLKEEITNVSTSGNAQYLNSAFIYNPETGKECMLSFRSTLPNWSDVPVVWENTTWKKGLSQQALFGYRDAYFLFVHNPKSGYAAIYKIEN